MTYGSINSSDSAQQRNLQHDSKLLSIASTPGKQLTPTDIMGSSYTMTTSVSRFTAATLNNYISGIALGTGNEGTPVLIDLRNSTFPLEEALDSVCKLTIIRNANFFAAEIFGINEEQEQPNDNELLLAIHGIQEGSGAFVSLNLMNNESNVPLLSAAVQDKWEHHMIYGNNQKIVENLLWKLQGFVLSDY